MVLARYRPIEDSDYDTLQALDLAAQRRQSPEYDTLPEREREGRLSTSAAALKFYARSGHSFVAEREEILGFALAQSVWQGDRPIVLVRSVAVTEEVGEDVLLGLMRAVVKSAYDTAVYEVHFPANEALMSAAHAEEAHLIGAYAVVHLGTRAQTAAGEKLRR